MKWWLLFPLLLCAHAPVAQTVVAAHAIRARSIIGPDDLVMQDVQTVGGISDESDIVGKEARVNLYAGRAIRHADVGPPAILERNQLVIMAYTKGALSILAEGRVLARAGVGERVRVMNLESRVTVTGRVMQDGTVEVGR